MKELYEIPMPCSKCPLLQEKLELAEKSLRKKTKKRKLILEKKMQEQEAVERFLQFAGIIS